MAQITLKEVQKSLRKIEFHGRVEESGDYPASFDIKISSTKNYKNADSLEKALLVSNATAKIQQDWLKKNTDDYVSIVSDRDDEFHSANYLSIAAEPSSIALDHLNKAVSFFRIMDEQLKTYLTTVNFDDLKTHDIHRNQSGTFQLVEKGQEIPDPNLKLGTLVNSLTTPQTYFPKF